ncbi:MAG: preprotein translocase subunit SecE [Candidatus Eremiobacteraeota bacterium]|nr:preprotein translocase subunit SecE [Candidatus Eremiobacteraeota bacterium]
MTASVNGSGNRPEPKSKAAEGRALDREKRWREFLSGFRAIVSEMKRVTWPSREEWVSATMVVVGLVVIVALWTRLISFFAEFVFKTGG